MNYGYEVNATLSEESSTYVRRKADHQLYEELKTGNFCYVFNARKTGKSSLRIQVMSRLKKDGVACSIIDMSGKNTQQTTIEKWYAGMLIDITKDFSLDINLRSWIREHDWLSPSLQFREFIETVLLKELSENIVIFIDEIDSVLSLNFPSDDFFAFIRACHNRRMDVPEYKRLTFCLLGVATPSDLIADKQRTPFNIGRAIELTGFTLAEAKTGLLQGFVGKMDDPEVVLEEVLAWTQGQPFLTQKLCKIIVDKAESRQPNVAQLVQKYLVHNWQSQDEPEHLKTIRDRITSNEHSAGRLLGLYQQILLHGSVATDDSPEQAKMNLTGLVAKQDGELKVYNRVYQSVFNLNWVEKELARLRPYAETFRAWVDSGYADESRLLRGEALDDALVWAETKSLSDRDYLFLRNSQNLEKQEIQRARQLDKLEAEIDLEVERKRLEAQAQANQILKLANLKARRRLRVSIVVLLLTFVIAIFAGFWATQSLNESQTATTVERQGMNALKQFESQEIESLLLAMSAGQELQKLVKGDRPLAKYPSGSPQLALQTILDGIYEQNQLKGHTNELTTAKFSPDGQRIVTASKDGTARVWDATGKPFAELKGHTAPVINASFSPDGQRIVTASGDKTARVWDTTGKLFAELKGHTVLLVSASFSPDGQRIVTASMDGTARLWDTTGKQLAELKGHTAPVDSVSFSPDGQRIITASMDGTARVWDTTGKQLAELKGHTDRLNTASFSPDGQRIITASTDGTARIWDATGKQLAELRGQVGLGVGASFSPDGQRIATAFGRTAQIWDTTGKQLAELRGHTNTINSISFSSDGQRIITGADDTTARVWDTTGRQLSEFSGHTQGVTAASFSPDGQRIVTASKDRTARTWDTTRKPLTELKGHTDEVSTASFSPDGQRIITASRDKTVRIWDTTGKQLTELKGHTRGVSTASFSLDGQRIVTASGDSTAQVWDATGKPLAELKHADALGTASFSPDRQRIVTTSESKDGTARVWDATGKPLAELRGHTDFAYDASFSPDGKRIVTASEDKTARVWDTDGRQLAELRGHTDAVYDANFSPDGQRIVTASEDKTARVWDTDGKQLAELRGHTGQVYSASFSPNGQRIVTASGDSTVRVWDTDGKQLAEFRGHGDTVYDANFSPDGQRIVTASVDRTAQVQQARNLHQLLSQGCERLNHYLITHPRDLEKLAICQKHDTLVAAAPFLVKEGEEAARKGSTDDAIATFRQALKWDSKLHLDPERKAQQMAEALKLVEKGENLVQAGNAEGAVATFQTALKLDPGLDIEPKTKVVQALLDKGRELISDGQIKEAIAAYAQAQSIPEVEISANSWNRLCWRGSLRGQATNVIFACEKAVTLASGDGFYRDSRGLARALTGDTRGAIEDFQAFIAQTNNQEKKSQRQGWVNALRAGKQPFTEEELKKLLSQNS